ncbi:MAG: hypothetical protein GWN62_31360, partial [Aliifodinibius sp.]|nr:hypothetical protein [Fodinibius sp.]NIW79458.1 hypothetical protein [Calditrichia bacterium]
MRPLIISLITILFSHFVFAQTSTRIDFLPYLSYWNYQDTFSKDHSLISGVYGYYGLGLRHVLESDIAYSRISYSGTGFMVGPRRFRSKSINIDQLDLTAAYTNYSFPNLKVRGGMHYIISDDSLTNNGFVLFSGIHRYRANQYTVGLDVYGSFYSDYNPDLKLIQLTGQFGFYFGNYFTTGSFFAQTKGYYINLSDKVSFGDDQYASIEQSLSYFYKDVTLKAFFWTGFQVLGVQNDGFV